MPLTSPRVSCPLCNSAARFENNSADASIWRCTNCTHAFSKINAPDLAATYNNAYYDEHHWRWFAYPNYKIFDWIIDQIPATSTRVLDLGCGKGQFLHYLRKKHPHLELVGIDVCDNEKWDDIRYIKMNFEKDQLPAYNQVKFDVIVSLMVIEHISDPSAYIARAKDLIIDDGALIIMTINEGGLIYGLSRTLKSIGVSILFDRLYSGHHVNHFSKKSLNFLILKNELNLRARRMHDSPLSAVDLPERVARFRWALIPILYLLFIIGRLFAATLSQTVVVEKASKR